MAAAIEAVAPGRMTQDGSGDPESLHVTLVLTRASANLIEGHLRWIAAGSPPAEGPPVTAQAIDAPLSANIYPNFARGLLQVSDLPF